MPIDLGFAEKCESWLLESRFFPSKVGGKPAWLYLKSIPGEADLQCEYCKEPCIFLCQIYAPYEENEHAFHRTIFVFVCTKAECSKSNKNGNFKVLRSQLARTNEFYPFEPPIEQEDWKTDICVNQWLKTCQVCGILAPKHCSKCKITNYCSRAHQICDWKHGHKESCTNKKSFSQNKLLFPEYEIVIEKEHTSDESNSNNFIQEEQEIKKYKKMVEDGEAGIFENDDVQDELLQMPVQKEDETFSEFRLTIDNYPEQILRYDRGGEVLYISASSNVGIVPRCPECNGERQFEFQIMPQLLNFLNLEDALKCIDWGILAIFTCIKSCVPKNGYSTEYIWKQDITDNFDEPSKA